MAQKIYSKMHPVSCINTYHDVTDSVNHGMVKNTNTWMSWKRNIFFLRNKKILYLCLRWHIFISYRFLADVTFNISYRKISAKRVTAIWFLCLISSKNFFTLAGNNIYWWKGLNWTFLMHVFAKIVIKKKYRLKMKHFFIEDWF